MQHQMAKKKSGRKRSGNISIFVNQTLKKSHFEIDNNRTIAKKNKTILVVAIFFSAALRNLTL